MKGATKPEAGKASPSFGNFIPQQQPQEMGSSSHGELPNTQAADVFDYGRAMGLHSGNINKQDLDTSKSVSLADSRCLLAIAATCAAATNCFAFVPGRQMNTLPTRVWHHMRIQSKRAETTSAIDCSCAASKRDAHKKSGPCCEHTLHLVFFFYLNPALARRWAELESFGTADIKSCYSRI